MFDKLFKRKETSNVIDSEYEARITELYDMDLTSEEYGKAVDNLKKLKELSDESKDRINWKKIKPDTIVSVGGTIFCVIAMMCFEHVAHGSFSTKAFGFVPRPKV